MYLRLLLRDYKYRYFIDTLVVPYVRELAVRPDSVDWVGTAGGTAVADAEENDYLRGREKFDC